MNLFAYGTLMCPGIIAEVATPGLQGVPGILHGYKCWAMKGEVYPAIRRHPDARVRGVLYRDLPEHAWSRLDRFEGDMYLRRTVSICLEEKATANAETYVLHEDFAHCLAPREWDFETFMRQGKGRFKAQYMGYDALE